jgi:asparagine synthase (glutamine-hydrolysing)
MKWILKRAFRDIIPPEIQTRSKMGFGVPLGAWFRGDLKPYLLDHLGERAVMYEYVEQGFLRTLLSDHFAGRADHGIALWLILTLELWLRGMRHAA